MKSTTGWVNNGNGNNSSGFNGLPGGYRSFIGTFYNITKYGFWWSSTEYDTNFAWARKMDHSYGDVGRNNTSQVEGFSVRCLRD